MGSEPRRQRGCPAEHRIFMPLRRARSLRTSLFQIAAALIALAFGQPAYADNPFDLSGPQIKVRVSRAGKTLPIAEVPNLQPGDQLWLSEVLPPGQSVRFLLIAAFLRGTTNPPPDAWFTKAETWSKRVRSEGVHVAIPEGAEQALLFLAPVTGGDFDTLRSAVRARPGQFVRAAQDLDVASLNRLRLEKYLDGVQDTSTTDPKQLQQRSTLLARSLNIKIDEKCFALPRDEQASCLTQNTSQLVLDDPHTESMVAALTTGSASDLIGQVSGTPMAGGGAYSPYVGAIVDVVRIMGSIHTAHYQYLPALALPNGDTLSLKLNNPPSFQNPKSVLVVGLPPVSSAKPPPLRSADPKQTYCLRKPSLVLPVEGAPLVFATNYAHDISLRLKSTDAVPGAQSPGALQSPNPAAPIPGSTEVATLEFPATADPASGGFLIDTSKLGSAVFAQNTIGALHGDWGFGSFDGPPFNLQGVRKAAWYIRAADKDALVVGHDDTLRIHYDDASCVESVAVNDSLAKPLKTAWKLTGTDEIDVEIPLQDATPGKLTLLIQPFSPGQQVAVPVETYADAASVTRFTLHAGDSSGSLIGTRLDQVASLSVKGITFSAPNTGDPSAGAASAQAQTAANPDGLLLTTKDPAATSALRTGEQLTAKVALKDGRELELPFAVAAARPRINLISKSILPSAASDGAVIRLGNKDDLAQNARLSFFLKSQTGAFPRDEKIEVATADGAIHTTLGLSDGALTLQDEHTVVATFDPQKSFGGSAFGPLRFRAVSADGTAGDWQPLANLVRVPTLKNVLCPDDPAQPCTLSGANLFLINSLSSNPAFDNATQVPPGMAANSISVPRPNGTLLYLKLSDDPGSINVVALPVLPE